MHVNIFLRKQQIYHEITRENKEKGPKNRMIINPTYFNSYNFPSYYLLYIYLNYNN